MNIQLGTCEWSDDAVLTITTRPFLVSQMWRKFRETLTWDVVVDMEDYEDAGHAYVRDRKRDENFGCDFDPETGRIRIFLGETRGYYGPDDELVPTSWVDFLPYVKRVVAPQFFPLLKAFS